MTKQELKTQLENLVGKTVVRKANDKVNGLVVGYSAKQKDGEWKIKLTVEWEGAANGTLRFNGSKWNTTSQINLNSLIILYP